jgi:hypothetical protein
MSSEGKGDYLHSASPRGDRVYRAGPCGSRTAPYPLGPWSHCVSCRHATPPPMARARQHLGRLVLWLKSLEDVCPRLQVRMGHEVFSITYD